MELKSLVLPILVISSVVIGLDLNQLVSAQLTNNTLIFGNFTVDSIVADGQNITAQNITIQGKGNITMSGNITITVDNQTQPMDVEELLLTGDLDLGCRRCHELGAD
jgi:hypothetical protein